MGYFRKNFQKKKELNFNGGKGKKFTKESKKSKQVQKFPKFNVEFELGIIYN